MLTNKDHVAIIEDDDLDEDLIDNVRPSQITCENCLFRNNHVLNETRAGHNKYLCRLNPPSIIVMENNKPVSRLPRKTIIQGDDILAVTKRVEALLEQLVNKTVDKALVPVLPIVRSFDYCSHWISRETKETYESVMDIR